MLSKPSIVSAVALIATIAASEISSAQTAIFYPNAYNSIDRGGSGKFPSASYGSVTGGTRHRAPRSALPSPNTVTGLRGELLGADPDANVRYELRRDWSRGK